MSLLSAVKSTRCSRALLSDNVSRVSFNVSLPAVTGVISGDTGELNAELSDGTVVGDVGDVGRRLDEGPATLDVCTLPSCPFDCCT